MSELQEVRKEFEKIYGDEYRRTVGSILSRYIVSLELANIELLEALKQSLSSSDHYDLMVCSEVAKKYER